MYWRYGLHSVTVGRGTNFGDVPVSAVAQVGVPSVRYRQTDTNVTAAVDHLAGVDGRIGAIGGVEAVVAAEDAGKVGVAERLGIKPGMVVQEIGWDEDVDDTLRAAIEERSGSDLLDEDADEVVDVVLLWWRDEDGDLADALLDVRGPLDDEGVIWVLTPKTGRDGHVEPSDIADAVSTTGMAQTSNVSIGEDWTANRLVSPKSANTRR